MSELVTKVAIALRAAVQMQPTAAMPAIRTLPLA